MKRARKNTAGNTLMINPIFKPLLDAIAPPERKIITHHVYPPIPIRTSDWCAYRDGDEEVSGRYGWGRTEAEAVADLLEMEDSGYISRK